VPRVLVAVATIVAVATAILVLAASPGNAEENTMQDRLMPDLEAIQEYRKGAAGVVSFVRSNPDIFRYRKGDVSQIPDRKRKEAIWDAWKALLDYYLALESIRGYYGVFYKIDDRKVSEEYFIAYYASFLAQYRNALEFIALMDEHDAADTILNEPVGEIGLPGRMYAKFKFRFLNVLIASEFAALEVLHKAAKGDTFPDIRAQIAEDSGEIWRIGKGKGELLTVKNALTVVGDAGKRAFFPVQSGVAHWMGDVRVQRGGAFLISREQLQELLPKLEPGDIILQRREWFLSNVGLPGFWTHAALFIGDEEKRREFFKTDEVERWIQAQGVESGEFEDLFLKRYPEAYRLSNEEDKDGDVPRVIESVGKGVVFTSLEHSGSADSMAVLRPRLTPKEKAEALLRAIHYSGRPYDFQFDFMTDAEIVCSELVFKAYEPNEGFRGLRLPLKNMLGRMLMPPNEMARIFDEHMGSDSAQFDLVAFLDGFEKGGEAIASSVDEFRKSWRRPKWHIMVQEKPKKAPDGP
jgi:hypothetical protein